MEPVLNMENCKSIYTLQNQCKCINLILFSAAGFKEMNTVSEQSVDLLLPCLSGKDIGIEQPFRVAVYRLQM